MDGHYNMRSPAVKRLMREAQELSGPTEQYFAQPLDDNLFEWHFTIRGPSDTEFDGGVYHGRIILPPEYPMKPPSIIFLTPNGRFDCFSKICLSISKHHPESWQPSWSIRTALLAIIGFMPTPGHGAIGSLDYTPEERKVFAKKSMAFKCERCGLIASKVLPLTSKSDETKKEIMDLAAQMSMTAEKSKGAENDQQAVAGDPTAGGERVAGNVSPSISHVSLESTITHRPTAASPPKDPPASADTSPTPSPSASSQSTTPLTSPSNSQRPGGTTQELNRPRSTSCFDRTTFWALVVVGTLLAALIFRRLAKFKYLLGEDDL